MKLFSGIVLISLLFVSCSKSGGFVNDPDVPEYLHTRPVGSSAWELLSSTTYSSLKVEILYMPGFAPDPAALDHMQATLAALINKPSGITVVTKEIPASTKTSLSINDIIEIEKNNRTVFTRGTEIAVSIIYTNTGYTDANTLGVAYRNTSAAIFTNKIKENSGGLGQTSRTKLEATVLEHEMGHLLGLVDLGSTMQTAHKDGANGNHCNNTSCLMYYASETTDILGFLVTGNIPSLDANCRADLRGNGGK